MRPLRRGQIWWVSWEPHRGSEQAGRRPSLIIHANEALDVEHYPLTIVLAMTTSSMENRMRVNVEPTKLNGLSQTGYVKCEQIMTIAKSRLDGYVGQLEPYLLAAVDERLRDILGLI